MYFKIKPMEGENFTTKESTELLQHIATNMVTKEDVRVIIREEVPPMINKALTKAKNEIMDYVDKKDREYKGELNLKIQKEDERVSEAISHLHKQNIIDEDKTRQLKKMSPFFQAG